MAICIKKPSFTWVDGTGWLNVTGMNGDICGKFTVNWQNDTAKV